MTVFKTFIKVLYKNKGMILLYTAILLVFCISFANTGESALGFVANKPSILIISNDEEIGLTKNLITYLSKHGEIMELDHDKISDALFYRKLNYVIYLPDNYRTKVLSGHNPQIEVRSSGDYQASYAEMMLNRYLKIASIYQKYFTDEEKLIKKINETLAIEAEVNIMSTIDTNAMFNAAYYYNFLNYSLLASCVFLVCMMLASFKAKQVHKRTVISGYDQKTFNRQLLYSNALFVFFLWLLYIVIGYLVLGEIVLTLNGLLFTINSLVFAFCALTLALLIGNITTNKNAINGIVNIVALGTSFLCGAFVPAEWLPEYVISIAHLLPSYWYIQSNELLKTMEVFNLTNLTPVIINMFVVLLFAIIFIITTNFISKQKMKLN